jgi:hypothetical protein
MEHWEVMQAGATVNVRFLHDECLWSWELVDRESGGLIESAWQARWDAYESPDEAHAAGSAQLRRLALARFAC